MPEQDSDHPSTYELQAFLSGRLDDEAVLPIESHVVDCQHCCDVLAELNHAEDVFVAALRSAESSSTVRSVAGDPQMRSDEGSSGSDAVDDRSGTRIGPYRLLEPIGEGGMGIVYLCDQEHPVRRRVALKVIKPGMDSRQIVARFEAERQALAMMDHLCIARVFDAGTTPDGLPYFVMELVRGRPITEYCDEQKLSIRDRLELFVQVCHAVQHAHQKGIIHRDLKPSNVLVCLYDGRPVPKVIDFGVAKALEQPLTERTMFTRFGQIVGTLEYMSPEQAELSHLDVDTRSDVYSLGVLLYELLTAATPLESQRLRETPFPEALRMIREQDPQKPSTQLNRSTDTLPAICASRSIEPHKLGALVCGDLDWIVMKTLEKDRARRYETADALARDIQRYLDHEPIEARPPSALYWVKKLMDRHRGLVVSSLMIAAVLVLSTLFSVWQAILATSARQESQVLAQQRQEAFLSAQTARNESQSQLAQLTFQKGVDRCRDGNVAEGMFTLLDAWRLAPETDEELIRVIRTNLAAWRWQLPLLQTAVTIPGNSSAEFNLFLPDPQGDEFAVVRDQRAVLYDSHSGSLLPGQLPIASNERLLRVIRGGHYLVENATGRQVLRARQDGAFRDLSIPDQPVTLGKMLIEPSHQQGRYIGIERTGVTETSGETYKYRFWYLDDPSRIRVKLQAERGVLFQIVADDAGQDMLVVYRPQEPDQLEFWNLDAGTPVPSFSPAMAQPGPCVSWDGQSIMLVSTFRVLLHASVLGLDGACRWWSPHTGRQLAPPWQPRRSGSGADVSRDGSTLLSHGTDGQIRLFDISSGFQRGGNIPTRQRKRNTAMSLLTSHDGSMVFTADRKENVWVWDTRHLRIQQSLASHPRAAHQPRAEALKQIRIAFHPETRRTLLCEPPDRHRAQLIDNERSLTIGPPIRHDRPANPAFSPDGSLAATAPHNYSYGGEAVAYVWDAATGRPAAEPLTNPKYIHSIALAPDNQTIALGGPGGTHLWNHQDGQLLHTLLEKTAVQRLLFHDDGTILATGCRRGWPGVGAGLRLWNVNSGTPIGPFISTEGDVLWLSFVPGAHRLLGLSEFGELRVVDAVSGKLSSKLQLSAVVSAAAFSRDGTSVAAADHHGRLQQWNIESGKPVGPLIAPGLGILAVHYSPDGRLLAVLDAEGVIQVWDAPTGMPLGPPLLHHSSVVDCAWSQDGRHLFAVTESASSHCYLQERPVLDDPERIEDWLVVHSGFHRTVEGLQLLSGDAWQARKSAFEQRWPELDAALSISMDDRQWHQRRAVEAEHSDNARAALNHLDLLLKQNPDDWSLYARKGQVLLRAGASSDAEKVFAKAAENDSPSLMNWRLHETTD